MNKYRYMNGTTSAYEVVLSDVTPTQCLNGSDTFNAGSVVIVSEGIEVNDGTPVHQDATIGAYKDLRYNEIDGKTGALISAGFTYDSKVFSLSIYAQTNWAEIHSNTAEFPDPIGVTCLNSDAYDLAHANVNAFWTAGKDVLKGHLDSGRSLKKSIFDASDRSSVDAIVDNR
jgi:hypothetical protein